MALIDWFNDLGLLAIIVSTGYAYLYNIIISAREHETGLRGRVADREGNGLSESAIGTCVSSVSGPRSVASSFQRAILLL